MPDANAVRPDPVISFPADRVLWARVAGDQVAVTHRGQTTIYGSPAALREAVREVDGRGRALTAEAEAATERAAELEGRAQGLLEAAQARADQADADRRRARWILRLVEAGVVIGCVAAIVAFGLGLQL